MYFSKKLRELAAFLKAHRRAAIIAAVALAILLAVFGAKIALFLNFILGNDIIVKLDASSEALTLEHGASEDVLFSASVTTNPFCTAHCYSVFEDVSDDVVIERANFTLKPGIPIEKQFLVEPMRFGTGQRLYRFSMECQSFSTAFCHTSGKPTRRAIVVAVNYALNETELSLKSYLKPELSLMAEKVARIKNVQESLEETASLLGNSVSVTSLESNLSGFHGEYSSLSQELGSLIQLWEKQDYILLESRASEFGARLSSAESGLDLLNSSAYALLSSYNSFVASMESSYQQLFSLRESFIIRDSVAYSVNASIASFNESLESFISARELSAKELIAGNISSEASYLADSLSQQSFRDAVSMMASSALYYDALCEVSGDCLPHISIENVSGLSDASLLQACSEVGKLRSSYASVNSSLSGDFALQEYPDSDEFWGNISMIAYNTLANVSASYSVLNASINYGIIANATSSKSGEAEAYPGFNLVPAVVSSLSASLPAACAASDVAIAWLPPFPLEKVHASEVNESPASLSLREPAPQCCIFGQCAACCDSGGCSRNTPVVFLHGHAFNKDVSAEYSLDAFNKVQSLLEKDGYLNVGAITLYTDESVPPGIWGRIDAPVTVKASYYFDLFEEPENYVVVQTNSESIDTYAVRLKELIDRIKYRTGKPKVQIIATSMGGLVARRYVQVFGSGSVSGLILVGTPNKGIVGDVADFCPLIGERLECRDMSSGSLFLNKLNREPLPQIPIHNIVGAGCGTGNDAGDGIVLARNAFLDGASNYFINGTCTRLLPLHATLLDTDIHPEVYGIIKTAVESDG